MTWRTTFFVALSLALTLGCGGDEEVEPTDESEACEATDSCDDDPEEGDEEEEDNDPNRIGVQGDDCTTARDCAHNGACEGGLCVCHPPWHGATCTTLEMGTVDKSVYGYREGFPLTTSWGGSVQYDEASGLYIMLVSEYVEECSNWGWNSTVVVATSEAPEGPYEKEFRLIGVMSHEAMLSRGPDGEWAVYFTASVFEGGLPASGDADFSDDQVCVRAVSYTHLTLPTILRV